MTLPAPNDAASRPVRFSILRAYGRSALHGQHARTQEWDAETTTAMQRGTAVHSLILGGRQIIAYPGPVRRGKEYDAFVEAHPDHEILTGTEYDKARYMADAVLGCETAQPWLKGVREKTLRFEWNGLQCRATPDVRGEGFLTEVKTAMTADPQRFLWHALRMHYHGQMWFQSIGCAANGFDISRHMIVCVESAAPYPVTVFEIQPRALEAGNKLLVLWSERLKASEAAAQFPPYSQAIVPLDVPEEEVQLIYPEEDE